MTTIPHGEPSGLRTRMRSAERRGNPVLFYATGERWCHATGLRGGVWHGFWLRCPTAVFVYLTHSAVVSRFETARTLRTREKGWDESDPPQKWGVMRSQKEVLCGTLFSARLTGRSRPHLSLREG